MKEAGAALLRLPLQFDSVTAEVRLLPPSPPPREIYEIPSGSINAYVFGTCQVNLLAILHLMSFGSGYEPKLQASAHAVENLLRVMTFYSANSSPLVATLFDRVVHANLSAMPLRLGENTRWDLTKWAPAHCFHGHALALP